MLITTLPPVYQTKKMIDMIFHPLVSAVRYNIGTDTAGEKPNEILKKIISVCEKAKKELFLDIKGRQLRVIESSIPRNAGITLNHSFSVDLPAMVYLRNEKFVCNLLEVKENKIFLDPIPEYVGKGQAVNVIGNNLLISGYLTEEDREFLFLTNDLGVCNVIASFFESELDLIEIRSINHNAKVGMKIESKPGIEFVKRINKSFLESKNCSLIAARDDLIQNLGIGNPEILDVLDLIIKTDSCAILASCIFNSLKREELIDMADISDLRLMQILGYKKFMLSDGISHYRFDEAMKNWKNYILKFPFD